MREAIAKQRAKRVKAIEARDNLREGMYRVREKDQLRWFAVWIEFYPAVHWMVKEVDGPLNPSELEGTRRRLDDELRGKLEAWV